MSEDKKKPDQQPEATDPATAAAAIRMAQDLKGLHTSLGQAKKDLGVAQTKHTATGDRVRAARSRITEITQNILTKIGKETADLPLFDGLAEPGDPNAWREVPIDQIVTLPRIAKALKAADITTLGSLRDFTARQADDGFVDEPLTVIDGIGPAASERITKDLDAWRITALVQHPEWTEA